MENPIHDVLTQPTKPSNEPPSSSKARVTRSGKFTAYFTGQVVIIAILIAFFAAVATVAHFRDQIGAGILRELGAGFMVWGIATLVLAVAIGAVPYFFWSRDTQPPRSRIP
jgi:hypothetical protein